jgi:hypothetical protein
MKEKIVAATINSIKKIKSPRYFKSERGYQGVLFCHLFNYLEQLEMLDEDKILEQEYQKSQIHGLGQRPDIIFHIPREHSGAEINENNYAVWALKARASREAALEDFDKLEEMFYHLHYPLGLFVNIDSDQNHLERYAGSHHEKIIGLAVRLIENEILIKQSWFIDGNIQNSTISIANQANAADS